MISRYVSMLYFVIILVRRTGVPLARFQHWGELAQYLAAASAAGVVGWVALEWAASRLGLAGQVAFATAAMVAVYVPLARLLRLPLLGFAHGRTLS